MLKAMFGDQQMETLADMIQAALMLKSAKLEEEAKHLAERTPICTQAYVVEARSESLERHMCSSSGYVGRRVAETFCDLSHVGASA